MNIKSGDTIKSDRWPEPVKIDLLKDIGEYIQLVGSTIHSRTHIDQLLHKDEVNALESLKLTPNFTAEARHVFLSLEALRYRYAALYDSLFAVNASKVDPLPHQVDAVYGHVLKLPRIRFLIADDPGAGKTIMAGLIIKELKLRHLINRVLIVVPGHLKKEKQFIRVLGPQMRTFEDLSGVEELIDILHYVLLLWERSSRDEMLQVLRDSGFGDTEAFYRVAQAISETLPIESREKKLLDGFLAGRERVREQMRQGLLF